jgi:hypothetical protein
MYLLHLRLDRLTTSSSSTSVIWSPVPQLELPSAQLISRIYCSRLLVCVRGAFGERPHLAAKFLAIFWLPPSILRAAPLGRRLTLASSWLVLSTQVAIIRSSWASQKKSYAFLASPSFRRSSTADRQPSFPCTALSLLNPGFGGEGVGPSCLFSRPGSPPAPAAPSLPKRPCLRQTYGGSSSARAISPPCVFNRGCVKERFYRGRIKLKQP